MMLREVLTSLNSIKYKFLIAILGLVILVSFITAFLWYVGTSIDAEESATDYMSEMLRVSNDNLEVALRDINSIITAVSLNEVDIVRVLSRTHYSSNADILNDNRKIEDDMLSLFSYKHYLSGLMVSDLKGRSFTSGITMTFDQIKQQSWYPLIIKSNEDRVFIPPHYVKSPENAANNYKDMVISISRPIFNDGSVLGFVLADVRSELLYDIFNINLKNNGAVAVVDNATGEIIFRPENGSLPKGFGNDELKLIAQHAKLKPGHFYTKIDNKEYLVIERTSTLTNWTMIGLIPKAKMLQKFYKTRDANLWVTLLLCLLAIPTSFLLASLLTKHIRRLNKAMKKMDKDHMDISVNIGSNDEIGQLSSQFNSMVYRMRELIEDIIETEREKRKAEIRALQAQINPHFLYNTLNTIKFLAVLQGADSIKDVSESLSTLMHINMQDKVFITLEDELAYLQSYISIQEYKYSNKFKASFTVSDEARELMVLKLLLQPLVENALIHGIGPMKEQGMISIKIYKENQMLKLRVQDNGAGMDEETIKNIMEGHFPDNSVGIANVRSRIRLTFGEPFDLIILSQANLYTIVELSVPVITEDKVKHYAT